MSQFLDDLGDMFPRHVGFSVFVSQDIAGKPTYGAGSTYHARIEMKDVGVRTKDGTVIAGRGIIYFPQIVNATVRDRVTVPFGIPGPTNPPILSVTVNDDEDGGSYTALVFG